MFKHKSRLSEIADEPYTNLNFTPRNVFFLRDNCNRRQAYFYL